MSLFADTSCGCEPPLHPETAAIPAGQTRLAQRQRAGFPEYREAMLQAIRREGALAGWRARSEGDPGVMLLEGWAYVLDVTGFYDARIAERAYIGTAPDTVAAQRLVGLIGYRPRGAVAASLALAVEIDGADPLLLPRGTGFRSEGFGKEPPQVFEIDADSTAWPQRNRWRLAPVRGDRFDGTLRFLPRAAPPAGAVVLVSSGSKHAAARVAAVAPETGPDAARYQRLDLAAGSTAVLALAGRKMAKLSVAILRLPLPGNGFVTPYDAAKGKLTLDSVYPQLAAGSRAAVEINGVLTPVKITKAHTVAVTIPGTDGAKMTATRVTLVPKVAWNDGQGIVLHAIPVMAHVPVAPAKPAIALADIAGNGALVAPVMPLGAAPAGGDILLAGAALQGARIDGTIVELGFGAARVQAGQGSAAFTPDLVAPVDLFGNVVIAVRGETVVDEIIGSADAGRGFATFPLAKKPLAWREDAAQPGGRRPELTVTVDGIAWTRVDSFFGQPPTAEVYIVQPQPDGTTRIGFGDGKRGARPPSGVDNIRATYRFGAGAATPPPGGNFQAVRALKPLGAIHAPVAASGGADADSADAMRTAAPAAALTIGRAVSAADFVALARGYPGVVNAGAGWAWDARGQRAVVTLWVIASGADPSAALKSWLAGQAAPDQGITVTAAMPANVGALTIKLVYAPRYTPALVAAAAQAALFDPATGLLAPARQAIGAALFRSAISAALHAVPGVTGVDAILVGGVPMAFAIAPGQGRWFDFAATASVG